MIVNIIASRNRVSGEIRTGIRLRIENPPPGVSYRIIEDPIRLSPSSDDFYITGNTTFKWFLKALIEPAYSLRFRRLTHAFFLNLYIPPPPGFRKSINRSSTYSRNTSRSPGRIPYTDSPLGPIGTCSIGIMWQ